ncbi:MAG TPA: HAD family hydrolase [Candidatus Paceibacterota bacterium]|nr:HAD family hydrolase [Verrucomicrobiota bacterium]HRY52101.1 HAD family hydrolase [Candidatus Paceibacterota bacterium]HSA02973.1 HAD family hydrolase [Candidatus Paceibacterota bacterium]
MNRGVFLDRDGVLIEEKGYLHRVEDVVVLPGIEPALSRLCQRGFLLFIVTNQSGVGRGYYTMEDVRKVHEHLDRHFRNQGVIFQKTYVAPEAPDQPSRGRKPSPQFLFDAREEFGVDLAASYMIGDKLIDLECGWNAGVRKSILVRTGYGARLSQENPRVLGSALVVDHLGDAADWILRDSD